jgi:hypothetical protein
MILLFVKLARAHAQDAVHLDAVQQRAGNHRSTDIQTWACHVWRPMQTLIRGRRNKVGSFGLRISLSFR